MGCGLIQSIDSKDCEQLNKLDSESKRWNEFKEVRPPRVKVIHQEISASI